MRESKSKTRKTSTNNSDESNSTPLQTELELIAVKAKNADLIKAHTKLVQENSEMRNQIFSLQADLIEIQAKCNNLESNFKNIVQNMKRCTPNLIDVLNLFLQVSDSRQTSFNMLNSADRLSDIGFSSKNKAITHTVKPHTVNGTVLNLVPTISLTRLNTTDTRQQFNEVSSNSHNSDYRYSLPSTSTSEMNEDIQNENLSPNVEASEQVENQSFVSRRRKTTSSPKAVSNGPLDFNEDDVETEEQFADESDQEEEEEEENLQRLSTIEEESSICSNGRKRTSLGEVRIYLSRLSNEDMPARRSQNTSTSSTDANASDTCLNIETTVIDNRVSKRVRADIMVFSPHTNSTRVESDNSMFNDLSPRDSRKNISAIQSAEVTPSTGVADGNEPLTSNQVMWLPTPSMSAMGDIDTSNSKLEILKESEDTDTTNDKNDITGIRTPQRYTRSSKKIKTGSHSNTKSETPESSLEDSNRERSVKTFVNGRRGASGDRPLTPTIILERLENILPERGLSTNSINIQILTQTDESNENENLPRKRGRKSKKSKTKPRTKSPKRSVKRKLKDDEEQETDSLQDKIREIQIRLSNYIPEASETSGDSSEEQNQRPQRAARPKTLKDASLKGKLRRMF